MNKFLTILLFLVLFNSCVFKQSEHGVISVGFYDGGGTLLSKTRGTPPLKLNDTPSFGSNSLTGYVLVTDQQSGEYVVYPAYSQGDFILVYSGGSSFTWIPQEQMVNWNDRELRKIVFSKEITSRQFERKIDYALFNRFPAFDDSSIDTFTVVQDGFINIQAAKNKTNNTLK